MAGKYKLRNGAFSASDVTVKQLKIKNEDKGKNALRAPYIELYQPGSNTKKAYIFLGTAGNLRISSTAPVGPVGTAAFANKGGSLGTSA